MKGKVVVITGATSGIGQVAAEELAGMGARIVQVARGRERAQAALKRLQERAPGIAHSVHYADLSRISEMKRVAAEIAQAEPRIDVLINNAGAMFGARQVTEDGLERTFALNHLSYFVLANGLLQRLTASAPARIINTSSDAHKSGGVLDFSDLQSSKRYRGFRVYGLSKLCNILFTRELARRTAGTGVTANALHPGFVATRFGDEAGGRAAFVIGLFKHFALSPQKGAATLIYLASSPEVASATGQYFYKCRQATPNNEAQDDSKAQRLWQESARLAGLEAAVSRG